MFEEAKGEAEAAVNKAEPSPSPSPAAEAEGVRAKKARRSADASTPTSPTSSMASGERAASPIDELRKTTPTSMRAPFASKSPLVHAVGFSLTLTDLTPSEFDGVRQTRFKADLAQVWGGSYIMS